MTADSAVSARAAAVSPAGPALLLLSVLAAAALFRDGLAALGAAWSTVEYSHGPVIPMLSGLLFLHHLKAVPPAAGPVRDPWQGVALVALSVALALVGIFARIGDIVAYALILWVGGMILIGFGWRRGRGFWPSVLHLVFMLPLPGILYWKVSTALQLFSSDLGVTLIRMAGAPALLDGNIIDLGIYKLHVAEACSGLRYLFPIMSFSYVFATLYQGPWWHKAVLLLSAAPLAVLMNTLRIGLVGVLVHHFGIERAEGLSHFLEGWVIFIACVLLLIALARVMLWMQGDFRPLRALVARDFSGLGPQLARLRLVRPSAALLVATLIVGGTAAAWQAAPSRAELAPAREPLALFPRDIGAEGELWRAGLPRRLPAGTERALGADDHFWASFARMGAAAEEAEADLLIAWYADQTAGGIHSPEICLPGGGWEVERIAATDLAPALGAAEAFPVTRAVIQKGATRQLVYFWFEQPGARTASDYAAKIGILRNALVLGRTDGALVRLVTPIGAGESEAAADARLQDLLRGLLPVLPRFVPGL
jgi:exosortase D (VPLPA-CTERM-specific)